jgi:hypothetical protein
MGKAKMATRTFLRNKTNNIDWWKVKSILSKNILLDIYLQREAPQHRTVRYRNVGLMVWAQVQGPRLTG